SHTTSPASKAVHKANTKWRAVFCRSRHGRRTGLLIQLLPMPLKNSCSVNVVASMPISMNSTNTSHFVSLRAPEILVTADFYISPDKKNAPQDALFIQHPRIRLPISGNWQHLP